MNKRRHCLFLFGIVGTLLFILLIDETHIYLKKKASTILKYSSSSIDQTDLLRKGYNQERNLTIHILTWNRQVSLLRLLNSLLKTNFDGDFVNLVIHIDGGVNSKFLHILRL